MRPAPGLAASPPVRYILEVAKRGAHLPRPRSTDEPRRCGGERAAGPRGSGKIFRRPTDAAAEREVRHPFSEAGSSIVEIVAIPLAARRVRAPAPTPHRPTHSHAATSSEKRSPVRRDWADRGSGSLGIRAPRAPEAGFMMPSPPAAGAGVPRQLPNATFIDTPGTFAAWYSAASRRTETRAVTPTVACAPNAVSASRSTLVVVSFPRAM
jgi:hypothetical protein